MRVITEAIGIQGKSRTVVDLPAVDGESTIDEIARAIATSLKASMPSLNSAGNILASVHIVSSHGNVEISCKA